MKVLIYFKPPKGHDVYEGTRLRKSLKGACELSGVTWVDSLLSAPDIAHFLSPLDESKANDAKESGLKLVYSVGYSENDPNARYFDYPEEGESHLSKKSLRALRNADLILVPNQQVKDKLIKEGLHNQMDVLPPFVNLSRFEFSTSAEKDVFKRYFGIKDEERYVLATGDFSKKEHLEVFKQIAAACPNNKFLYFGTSKKSFAVSRLIKKLSKKSPINLFIEPLVEDDVYRSALANASCYVLLGDEYPDCGSLFDAFAAKTQVIAYGKQDFNPVLKDKVDCYKALNVPKAAKLITSLSHGKAKETIIAGYEEAKNHSLSLNASSLAKEYEKLLNQKRK